MTLVSEVEKNVHWYIVPAVKISLCKGKYKRAIFFLYSTGESLI